MNQRKLLSLTLTEIYYLFQKNFKQIVDDAQNSVSVDQFKQKLTLWIENNLSPNENRRKQLQLLINYDGKKIHELSTDETIQIQTLSIFWSFLKNPSNEKSTPIDFFIDLYQLFSTKNISYSYTKADLEEQMSRWTNGLDKEVQTIREKNKEHIILRLIEKIDFRVSKKSRFSFQEGISYEEKIEQVKVWWEDYRFHLALAIRKPSELNQWLNYSLSDDTLFVLKEAQKKGMPFFITPYYLSLLNTEQKGYNDEAIRSYILYSPQLVETYGNIRAWEKEDKVEPGEPNAAGWILPEGNNIHRRYPEVAILIPDTMGRACGGLCASCQRMYDFQSERLNFQLDKLKPKESWSNKLNRLMKYFEEDSQLRDILITGGDALMSRNKSLTEIFDAVYNMAKRKQEANKNRPDGEKYAEIQRVRLGSRLLAYLPFRINDDLVALLREFKEKAYAIGIKQFIIQTHFQSPLEVTPEAQKAIEKILSAGWLITNQLVFNVAASRRGHTAQLRKTLNKMGVITYYTFTVKGFDENYAVFAPNSRSVQEGIEEKKFGLLTKEQADELYELLQDATHIKENITSFLEKYNLPFLATDRNVLNLPAVGKSMTFNLVGISSKGKRILQFDHDKTRRHSPIINELGKVYIVENKSIASYLRELSLLGENVEDYANLWSYAEGRTEPEFEVYKYPPFNFNPTDELSNLAVTKDLLQ
ncbi:MAG: KamA family protein [Bacteroidales bacterium]|nr:KamA family protein [Bacteroidales bacterium]